MAIRSSACGIYFISFAWLPFVPSHIPLGSGHLGLLFFFPSRFFLAVPPGRNSIWNALSFLALTDRLTLSSATVSFSPLSMGPALPWTFPIPCATGSVSLMQEGLRFLASRPVLGDFPQRGVCHFAHSLSSHSGTLQERNPNESLTPLVPFTLLISTEEMTHNSLSGQLTEWCNSAASIDLYLDWKVHLLNP